MNVALVFAGISLVIGLLNLVLLSLLLYRWEKHTTPQTQAHPKPATREITLNPGITELTTTLWMLE